MKLTIIISTWNNCAELANSLACLSLCESPAELPWEVLVVNNNCTDRTDEVIGSYHGRLPIRRVFESRQGLSFGRNAGLAQARGQWILFTDDDVRPSSAWLREYFKAFDEYPDGYFFGGGLVSLFPGGRPEEELLSIASKAIRGITLDLDGPTVVQRGFPAANWAVEKKYLDMVGWFDPERGLNPSRPDMRFGEEHELQNRLREAGLRALYLPKATLGHIVPPWKCQPEYILSRAEASALNAARYKKSNFYLCIRLAISMSFFYVRYMWVRRKGCPAYVLCNKWRVRRGKLRGHLRSLLGAGRV